MRQVKAKNTGPEKIVRSLLHHLGYRFFLHRKGLPGTPDIIFPRRRVVVFVHGCFWHGHGCRLGHLPKSHLDFWAPKIQANRDRDRRNQELLEEAGWRVTAVWQCELADIPTLTDRLTRFLSQL